MDDSDYDCQTCGACCISCRSGNQVGYVGLEDTEVRRIKRLGLPVVQNGTDTDLGTVPYHGEGGERICVAFAGTVGERCSCSIYAKRPKACRTFEPGSSQCRMARDQAGLEEF